jgi:hypothetical protein
MYSKLIHYGCSFTYGEDSGGFGINDPDLSYPAHLSKKTNIPYINRANPGASLDQISLKIVEDLQNPDSEIHDPDVLVVVNLTSPFRILSTVCDWWPVNLNNHEVTVCNVNPATNFKINSEFTKLLSRFASEQEWLFYFYAFNTINSIHNQLTLYKKHIVYVDMLLNVKSVEQYFKFHSSIKNKMICGESGSMVRSLIMPDSYHSPSKHYVSEGYNFLAETVLSSLKEMKIL